MTYGEDLVKLKDALADEAKSTSLVIMHIEYRRIDYVSATERDKMVHSILELTRELNCSHKVFYRAVSLLDAFLSTAKTPLQYARWTTVTCFYIAAKKEKVKESDKCLQQLLVSKLGPKCTCDDIIKMEAIVTEKLELHVFCPTVIQFIKCFHSLALSSSLFQLPKDVSVKSHLSRMYKSAQEFMCNHELMKLFKPSILGLAVLGCDLKMLKCDWLSTILSLQTVAQIKCGLLSMCYEALAAQYPKHATQYQLTPPTQCLRNRSKTTPTISLANNTKETVDKENTVNSQTRKVVYPSSLMARRHLRSLSVKNIAIV